LNNSSIVTPKYSAIIGINPMSGDAIPFSYLLTD